MTEDIKECVNPDCHNPLTEEQMKRDGIYCSTACSATRRKPKKERVPLGRPRFQLARKARPGYVEHWFNDVDDRIQDAIKAGYSPVQDPGGKIGEDPVRDRDEGLGSAIWKTVGRNLDGTPIKACCMEIPEEFYKEDRAAKMREIDDDEEARLRQLDDGQYRPTDSRGQVLTEIKKVPIK